MLRVYLLGELKILWNDRELPPLSTQKANSIFGFLCLHPNLEFTREFLADILWADRPVGSAWHSLDAAVDHIRAVFTNAGVDFENYVKVTDETIGLHAQKNFWLDVIEFESTYNSIDLLVLQSAVQIYRGPLMENFDDAWCLPERRRMEQHYLQALKSLILLNGKAAQYKKVVGLAENYLKLNPDDEEVRAALLVALSGQSNLAGVVEHYEKYCEWLQHEHQAEPGIDLQHLVQQLTAGWQPAAVNQSTPQAFHRAPVSAQFSPVVSAIEPDKEQNIFVGRHEELAQITEWWEQRGEPVFCMTGEQGCGKTRLAQEFAYELQNSRTLVGWARCYTYPQGLLYPEMSDILQCLLVQVPASTRTKIPAGLVRDAQVFFPELSFLFSARPRETAVEAAALTVSAAAVAVALDVAVAAPAVAEATASTSVYNAVNSLVQFLSQSFPVLIVLDDFQHASYTMQQLFEHLLASMDQRQPENQHPVKILLLGTPDKMALEHSTMCIRVSNLLSEHMVVHLDLGNLHRDDVRQWLFLWSGNPHKVNALAEKLYLQTGGNPYFLKETIHTLTYTGSLLTSGQGWDGAALQGHDPQLPVPPAIRSQLENRLRCLSMLGLQVIQAAAVIGPLVPLHLLIDMIKRDGDDLMQAIDELLNAGLLAEFSDEDTDEEIFRFPCLLYKQTIYEQTTQVRKSVLEKRMVVITQEGRNSYGLL